MGSPSPNPSPTNKEESSLIENAERIVIDYANLSGRETENRAKFREFTVNRLRDFALSLRQEIAREVDSLIRARMKQYANTPVSKELGGRPDAFNVLAEVNRDVLKVINKK